MAASDWNRDGMLDIVSAAMLGKFVWLPSDKAGLHPYGAAQTVDPEIRSYTDVQVGDLDADGYDDLVVTDYDSLHLYRFDPERQTFERRVIEPAREPVEFTKAVDFDEDGWQDLVTLVVTADRRNALYGYRNQTGSGPFDEPILLATFPEPLHWFDLVDLDNDSRLDLVWSTQQQFVWQRRAGDGIRFEMPVHLVLSPARILLKQIAAVDIEDDGDVDLVVLSYDDLHLIENLGSGQFLPQVIDRFAHNIDIPTDINVGDLDGDGDRDIVFPAYPRELVWYEQRDRRSFVSRGLVTPENDSYTFAEVQIHDLNGDKRPDLLVRDHQFGVQLGWLEQTATGFQPLRVIDTVAEMVSFWDSTREKTVVLDMDRDGDLDIGAIIEYSERASMFEKIIWYENDGSGNFLATAVADQLFSGGGSLVKGDLDGDQRADLVFATAFGGLNIYRQRTVGDVDDNRRFDSADLVALFQLGTYEDALVGNSDYQQGDWNGDGEFDSRDLLLAFQAGHYQ